MARLEQAVFAPAWSPIPAFRAARRRRAGGARSALGRPGALAPPAEETLDALWHELTGRERPPGAPGGPVSAVAARLASSDAHRRAVRAGSPDVALLAGSTEAARALPAGTASPDGVAVAGRGATLHLATGDDAAGRRLAGAEPLPPDWLEAWQRVLHEQHHAARAAGVRLARLVAPDKSSLIAPSRGRPRRSAPLRELARALDRRAVPIRALRAAASRGRRTFFLTDTHVAPVGAAVLYRAAMDQWGLSVPSRLAEGPWVEAVVSGDLAAHFPRRIIEVALLPTLPAVWLDEDTTAPLFACGGHLGARRVVSNPDAPVDAEVVVMGGSTSFVDPAACGSLGALLAATFARVHHLWAPMSWDAAYIDRVRPAFVLLQTAERYVVVPPAAVVDHEALAAETLERKAR